MSLRARVPELAVAALVTGLYISACFSVVVRAGMSTGPFEFGPIYGLSCVLLGWMDFPVGWLANPILWIGIVLLALGYRGAASICGLLALGPAVAWSLEWHGLGFWHTLRDGYYLWAASIVVLITGSSVLWVLHLVPEPQARNNVSSKTSADSATASRDENRQLREDLP
jgi:hypothetical protein